MAGKRTLFSSHGKNDSAHGDRPWVYFMIDSFFLVTQFFVLTFHMGHDLVVPHTNPIREEQSGTMLFRSVSTDVKIAAHREQADSKPMYKINCGEAMDGLSLTTKLSELAVGKNPARVHVWISPTGKATFGDVMQILSICKKLEFKECGIQPSRLN